jgi:DNA-binding protein H-NS
MRTFANKQGNWVGHSASPQATSSDKKLRPKPRTPRNTRKSTPPKYQSPDHPAETWAGRGKRPAWVEAKLEAGITLADIEIK